MYNATMSSLHLSRVSCSNGLGRAARNGLGRSIFEMGGSDSKLEQDGESSHTGAAPLPHRSCCGFNQEAYIQTLKTRQERKAHTAPHHTVLSESSNGPCLQEAVRNEKLVLQVKNANEEVIRDILEFFPERVHMTDQVHCSEH